MIWVFIGGISGGILLATGLYWWAVARHRRTPSLTKYVVFSIAVLLVYSIAEFICSCVTAETGAVSHDTLTTCVYACFGGEILSCALIKIFKLKGENDND